MNEEKIIQTIASEQVESTDVLVCGAGPAGIAAAVSAARKGVRTTLIEVQGCLGGVWTSGCLSYILDHENKEGIMKEILERLSDREGLGILESGGNTPVYDSEVMKIVLEEMAEESGIHVRLHTRIVSAFKNEDSRITHVVTESKSGREAWAAKVFIDATGEGDLAWHAGCDFDYGRSENGEAQPMSLMAIIGGVYASEIAPYFSDNFGSEGEEAKRRLLRLLEDNGKSPSYGAPTLFRVRDDLFALMANHEYGFNGTDAEDVSRATLHARKEIHDIVSTLRRSGEAWLKVRLLVTANQIGIREGRRVRGRYTVSEQDMISGARHEDAICRASFCVDVHSTNPEKGRGYGSEEVGVLPYDIPIRAAIAADVDGLMMAGRCISGSFLAHASYRVTGNAVSIGEGVGSVAALAARTNRLPHQVKYPGDLE